MLLRVSLYAAWKGAWEACQADGVFPRDFSKRLVLAEIGAYKLVEKLWENALVGWIDSTFRTSDQSL